MNRDYGKKSGTAVKKMADGGEVQNTASFWDRMKGSLGRLAEGNIDQEGSVAYNKYGAGAAKGVEASDARQLARNESSRAEAAPATPEVTAEKTAANMAGDTEFGPNFDSVVKANADRAETDSLTNAISKAESDKAAIDKSGTKAAAKPMAPVKRRTVIPAESGMSGSPERTDATRSKSLAIPTAREMSPERTANPSRSVPAYETPYDRMNRQNREAAAARAKTAASQPDPYRESLAAGMKSGGMVKGYADGGKVEGRMYGKKC